MKSSSLEVNSGEPSTATRCTRDDANRDAPQPAILASTATTSGGTFAALRHRNFRLYSIGMLISVAGTWMQSIAQGWLVYEISGSARTLGLVAFAGAIPALVVSPWAGVIADRWNKRTILLLTQVGAMACALTLAALAFSGAVQIWQIMILAILLGAINAIDQPARQAFVVEMVGKEDLTNAIALNSMIMNGARIVGPAAGGILLALVGAAWCFLINGLTYIAVIAALLMMTITPFERRVRLESPWAELRDGLDYVRRDKVLATLLWQALIFSVFGIVYGSVLPAYVDQVLHVGAQAYGFINAAQGLGAVTSAYILARWGGRGTKGQWLVMVALIFPFLLATFAWSVSLPMSLGLAFFMGICFLGQFALINTLLQTQVDNAMRGRVMSLYTLTFSGFAPFGNLFIGSLADTWGMSLALTASAVITLGLSAINLLRPTGVRELP